jgi:hypothetical protein
MDPILRRSCGLSCFPWSSWSLSSTAISPWACINPTRTVSVSQLFKFTTGRMFLSPCHSCSLLVRQALCRTAVDVSPGVILSCLLNLFQVLFISSVTSQLFHTSVSKQRESPCPFPSSVCYQTLIWSDPLVYSQRNLFLIHHDTECLYHLSHESCVNFMVSVINFTSDSPRILSVLLDMPLICNALLGLYTAPSRLLVYFNKHRLAPVSTNSFTLPEISTFVPNVTVLELRSLS